MSEKKTGYIIIELLFGVNYDTVIWTLNGQHGSHILCRPVNDGVRRFLYVSLNNNYGDVCIDGFRVGPELIFRRDSTGDQVWVADLVGLLYKHKREYVGKEPPLFQDTRREELKSIVGSSKILVCHPDLTDLQVKELRSSLVSYLGEGRVTTGNDLNDAVILKPYRAKEVEASLWYFGVTAFTVTLHELGIWVFTVESSKHLAAGKQLSLTSFVSLFRKQLQEKSARVAGVSKSVTFRHKFIKWGTVPVENINKKDATAGGLPVGQMHVFTAGTASAKKIDVLLELKPLGFQTSIRVIAALRQCEYLHNPLEVSRTLVENFCESLVGLESSTIPGAFERARELLRTYSDHIQSGLDGLIKVADGINHGNFVYRPLIGSDAVKYGYTLSLSIVRFDE